MYTFYIFSFFKECPKSAQIGLETYSGVFKVADYESKVRIFKFQMEDPIW